MAGQIIDLQKARGLLTDTPDTVIATVSGGYTCKVFATFTNSGDETRLLYVELEGVRVVHGDSTYNRLRPGETMILDLMQRLEEGEEVTAWTDDDSTDVEFYITIGVIPDGSSS
jgi:hypothetical protein